MLKIIHVKVPFYVEISKIMLLGPKSCILDNGLNFEDFDKNKKVGNINMYYFH